MKLSDHADLANEIVEMVMEKLTILNPSEAMLVMGNVIFQIADHVNVDGKAGIFFDVPVRDPIKNKILSPLEEIILGALANKRIANGETKKTMKRKARVVEGDVVKPTVEVEDEEDNTENRLGVRRDPNRFKVESYRLGGIK
jgi:hypothetical protein